MLKKLVYLFCMTNLALLLQSCCRENFVNPLQITLISIPKQDSITVWGIKDYRALKKIAATNTDKYTSGNILIQTYWFNNSLDMSMNTSTLAIQYYNQNQVLQTDTVTLSYKRKASYERGCGAYVGISDIKLEKSTVKLPTQILIN
jgi:hypothetical protein